MFISYWSLKHVPWMHGGDDSSWSWFWYRIVNLVLRRPLEGSTNWALTVGKSPIYLPPIHDILEERAVCPRDGVFHQDPRFPSRTSVPVPLQSHRGPRSSVWGWRGSVERLRGIRRRTVGSITRREKRHRSPAAGFRQLNVYYVSSYSRLVATGCWRHLVYASRLILCHWIRYPIFVVQQGKETRVPCIRVPQKSSFWTQSTVDPIVL